MAEPAGDASGVGGSAGDGEGAARLVAVLTQRHVTLACAESLTAGLVSAGIADVPGASAVLRGGAVTYATQCKADVLGVPQELLDARGAVDPDVAVAMAEGTARLFAADLGVATTGVAGPSEQDGKAVGTVYVAVADRRELSSGAARCTVKGFHFTGGRAAVRRQAAQAAWQMVIDTVDA